jgi:hypothetical protein
MDGSSTRHCECHGCGRWGRLPILALFEPRARIPPRIAVDSLDEQAVHRLVAISHPRQRLAGLPPDPVAVAVGRKASQIDTGQQAHLVQLGTNAPPFVAGMADEEGRRLGAGLRDLRLRLVRQAPLAGVAAHLFQDRRRGRRA